MHKKQLTTLVVSTVIFLAFLLLTSPYKLPLPLVVVPGVAFIIAVHSLFAIFLVRGNRSNKTWRTIKNVLTATIAVAAVLLSVGQFTFRDFTLLLAFALLGVFYVSRLREN